MHTAEQRSAPRYAVHCRAALRDKNTDRRLPVEIYDLSATGAAICSSDFIVDDADYELEFTVPGDAEQRPLRAHCRVARVMLSADQSDFCAGLVFEGDLTSRAPALSVFFNKLGTRDRAH